MTGWKQKYWSLKRLIYLWITASILCLYFYVTPIQIQCPSLYIDQALLFNFLFKIFISLAALNVKCAWYLRSLSMHSLNFFIFLVICFILPITQTFFKKVWVVWIQLYSLQGTMLTLIGGGGGEGFNTKTPCNLTQGRVLGTVTNWCFVFFCS